MFTSFSFALCETRLLHELLSMTYLLRRCMAWSGRMDTWTCPALACTAVGQRPTQCERLHSCTAALGALVWPRSSSDCLCCIQVHFQGNHLPWKDAAQPH